MRRFFELLDDFAGTNQTFKWFDRVAFAFLVIMVVAAPHSIAASQAAWICGMFVWLISLFVKPRPQFRLGVLDVAMFGLLIWSAISAAFSYEPAVSFDRLRGVALFLVFYYVAGNLRNLRAIYLLAFALILSCMVNVAWMPIERAIGRGVEIREIAPDGPLAKILLRNGDAIIKVNGKKVRSPEEIVALVEQTGKANVVAYRRDYEVPVVLTAEDISIGGDAMQKLGLVSWKTSHKWRSSGFFGHYTTYAEVLQLIMSLCLGLLVVGFFANRRKLSPHTAPPEASKKRTFLFLLVSLLGMCVALLMTVTRASQLAFVISGFVIFLLGASRKWLFAGIAVGLPLILAGLFILQQSREVGFFDATDDSTLYRLTMWKDGMRLLADKPQHLVVGIGMDSIQKHWQEWDMFDGGKMPRGHFHSTPVQILVERGVPALLLWLLILGVYARSLLKGLKRKQMQMSWASVGILLGCFGGLVGFFASGIVHYNLGDQEVAMVFYLLMALALATVRLEKADL